MEDSPDYALSYFLKEKLELKTVMFGMIKNLEAKYGIKFHYIQFDNTGENVDFERVCKRRDGY